MKNRWTLSLAAVALVISAFPAFATQGDPFKQKSSDQKKMERKIDGAATTPYVTKHQGETLKKVVAGAEERKSDEKLTDPMQPKTEAPQPGQAPAPGAPAQPGTAPGTPEGQAEAPKAEEAKPSYRLMGTVCGKGPDLAIFDKGGDWPVMLKAGDDLDESTKVFSVENGKVTIEKIISAAQPAIGPHMGPDGKTIMPARPAQPEKKERYELYTW